MSDPRLQLVGATRTFDGVGGVNSIDLTVAAGEVHALVGLNGAGKTTLMRMALGMLRPQEGRALIEGHDVADMRARAWASVGHLIETPLSYRELTVRENLAVSARLHLVDPADIGQMVDAACAQFALLPYADRRARVLSLGNRQRLGLASALQHKPRLVVLDEPTNSLDPAGVIRLRNALVAAAAYGAGVLVSSHHLDEVARVADRVTVLNGGRVIGSLDPAGTDLERTFFDLVLRDSDQEALT